MEIQEEKISNKLVQNIHPFDFEKRKVQKIDIQPQLKENKSTKIKRTRCKLEQILNSHSDTSQYVLERAHNFVESQQFMADQNYVPQPYVKAIPQTLVNSYANYSENIDSEIELIDGPLSASFYNLFFYTFVSHGELVISPDDIWFQILLGFSKLVGKEPETFREILVSHQGKMELSISMDCTLYGIPTAKSFKWDVAFDAFENLIRKNAKESVHETFVADFTSTTPIGKAISSITIMDVLQHYFEYRMLCGGCGFKAVHMEGQLSDWEQILSQTRKLFQLVSSVKTNEKTIDHSIVGKTQAFLGDMDSVLVEFVKTFEGKPNVGFWNKCFNTENSMIQSGSECQKVPITNLTGWITKFFPHIPVLGREKNPFQMDGHNVSIEQFENIPEYYTQVPLNLGIEDLEKGGYKMYETQIISCFGGVLHKENKFCLQTKFGITAKNYDDLKLSCDKLKQHYKIQN